MIQSQLERISSAWYRMPYGFRWMITARVALGVVIHWISNQMLVVAFWLAYDSMEDGNDK